jgi:hypothetical protein
MRHRQVLGDDAVGLDIDQEACRFKLVSFPEADDLLFVDEYYYRAESQSVIAERLTEQMS